MAFFLYSILLINFLTGCQRPDPRFSSPAVTFKTYQRALSERDWKTLWNCYSLSYRQTLVSDSLKWIKKMVEKSSSQIQDELRREIIKEKIINDQIGYLLFDATTLPTKHSSPFFYFIHDPDGWKITSHLDTLFHKELERAIERNDFKLPQN